LSYTLAKDYSKRLNAPLKGFYAFNLSAHSPILEEPEKTLKIFLCDILANEISLVDSGYG
jgi:hypothetical protein